MMKMIIDKTKDLLDTGNKILAGLIVIPALVVSIGSFIAHFAYYISFLIERTYVKQIESIKRDKLDAIFSTTNLVEGHSVIIFTSIVGIIMIGMTLLSIICLVIAFFKYESKKMKGLMGAEVSLIVLSPFSVIKFIEEDMQGGWIIIFLVLFGFCLLFYFSALREYGKYVLNAVLFSYLIVPSFFLLLVNIIPLLAFVLAIVCIGLAIFLGFKLFLGGEDSQSGRKNTDRGYSASGRNTVNREYSSYHNVEKTLEKVERKPYQKEERIDLDTSFWRDKGGYEAFTPSADSIYFNDAFGSKKYICTVLDFEKGNVAIYNRGERITNIAGCKIPER